MKNRWQKILSGTIQDSKTIKGEIQALTEAGQAMEEALSGLQEALETARKALLAEAPGAIKQVEEAEKAVSENRNKVAAIASILKDLSTKLQEALSAEKTTRLEEIVSEVARIDEEAAAKRRELVESHARSCAIFAELTGQEFFRLDSRYFENHSLMRLLQNRIEELSPGGPSLFRRRENLTNEQLHLQKTS